MAIHIRRREFISTLAAWRHGNSRYAGSSRRSGVYRRVRTMTGIFALCAVLVPQVAASYGVRLGAIPEAYWGTWVPAAEICQDANKSAIVLSAKAYVTSAVSCAVDYVAETSSPKGPIYSARLQCTNMAGQAPKKVANLIIRPGDTNQVSMGPAFDSLKPYQRCSASGEARGPRPTRE
jgi:hypothetical protein